MQSFLDRGKDNRAPFLASFNNRNTALMAVRDDSPTFSNSEFSQLSDESDFEALLSPDGYLSICGFGSLLSERSARSTFPDLRNFRTAKLRGFRRIFCHVAPIFFDRGIANEETGEISSLSVEACEGETLIITVFEIKKSEVPSFIEREHEFRFLAVVPEVMNGLPFTTPAETRRSIFSVMVAIASIRYGGMISYRAVFIFDIVFWQQKILAKQPMTIS
ncbi:uncharacterized protein LOC143852989 isoform X2 [Tasmannia lanceolata]|uniref:uncharacterized protein LOC143852989 isoform X2 n=1 Tax=Tasmannia lanceolata TaxID=3420 RepID=UPI004062BA81